MSENAVQYLNKFIIEATRLTQEEKKILKALSDRKQNKIRKEKFMFDEDLNLKYANSLAPIIDAVKKGYLTGVQIEKVTGIKQNLINTGFCTFANYLGKHRLINLNNGKSKRQTVVDFIQSRLIDKDYIEKIPLPEIKVVEKEPIEGTKELFPKEEFTEMEIKIRDLLLDGLNYQQIAEKLVISPTTVKTHVSNIFSKRDYHSLQELLVNEMRQKDKTSENGNDYTALINENEQLRKRITELENQSRPVVNVDLSSVKAKINQDIKLLTQKLQLIEELEEEFKIKE